MSNLEDIKSSEVIYNDMDKKCAPGVKFEHGACIDLLKIIEMAKAYNAYNGPSKSIKLYPEFETLNPTKYKKYLLKQMKKHITQCSSHQCWTEQKFMDRVSRKTQEELNKYTFRFNGPEGKFEWLNTININDVMGQYEKKYPDFKFLGAVPADFEILSELGIGDMDFNELMKQGKTKIGLVMNMDTHKEPGSHWVAIYASFKDGKVYYFDSYGTPPEPLFRKFMRRIYKFYQDDLGIKDPISDYSRLRHQYKNSECGVYSMRFILGMLKGETFESFSEKQIPDKVINKCRNKYFKNVDIK